VVIGAINEMPAQAASPAAAANPPPAKPDVDASVKANVAAAMAEPHRKPDPRVARAVGLLLGSPEFQHR
jgi:hypothetical protein